ncbi:MAG: preprotein translocase subunit SecA [Alphaproteobacteria bacterium]|nr:MAG: preprotein translocase subunit SecA [Alphaproteobacteria bacterium]
MLNSLAKRIFGTPNDRYLKKINLLLDEVNNLEQSIINLTDQELKNTTVKLKEIYSANKDLDAILPEAFATVREAAKRVLGQRHYDAQILGGIVLHQGKISEMKTGEGKTLVSTLPTYLNAITGKGVHIVTVNDYLARRDSEWMGQIYNFLGLSVGCVIPNLDDEQRKQAYNADITYATNNELGFDFLRDNMKFSFDQMVQREFNFAIVDEVDSILIDEARTPLIISGPTEDNSELYKTINKLMPELNEEDLDIDEKTKSVALTEQGNDNIEKILKEKYLLKSQNLYDPENVGIVHHINQAVRANKLFEKDKDYIVSDNKVVIIDEFTGRMMEGRRFSDGLHQALEAKENVSIKNENQTLASVTFQNYFRMYPKLAGMTGTALTEANEFIEIYSLEVISVPTHKKMIRIDQNDEVYRTAEEKWDAVINNIKIANKNKQPVLVGTTSIEKSEMLSSLLKKEKIKHNVLNARNHEEEASIIASAGVPNSVTIATNMAGRGTDIQLGGNKDMIKDTNKNSLHNIETNKKLSLESGGLLVIGTERHESRRTDNQLRGRSGRQGDPGESKFFLSLEDDLMRIFGTEKLDTVLQKLGLKKGEAIIHTWVNRALQKAQEKVEGRNFEIRKSLLRFDDVMNDQRKAIYEQRRELMQGEDISETIINMRNEIIDDLVSINIPEKAYAEQWDIKSLSISLKRLGLDLPLNDWSKKDGVTEQEFKKYIKAAADDKITHKEEIFGKENMQNIEKQVMLQVVDQNWKEHLLQLDQLKQGIGLRAYAQRDPLNEYKSEAFNLFQVMLGNIRNQTTTILLNIEITSEMPERKEENITLVKEPIDNNSQKNQKKNIPVISRKIGRNEVCPTSNKKYKHCYGTENCKFGTVACKLST